MSWRLVMTNPAERDLSRMDRQTIAAVRHELDALLQVIDGPHQPPPGTKRLRHVKPETWRLRIGDWRALFRLDRSAQLLQVVAVKHRSEVYDR